MVRSLDTPPDARPPNSEAMRHRRRRKPGDPRYVSLRRLIPNLMTAAALASGVMSFHYAQQGRFDQAMLAIGLAFLLDGLDGRLARLLKASTRFGEKFDSIADFTSFGFAPAFLLYQWHLKELALAGVGVVMLYALCAAYRLARFTKQAKRQPVHARPGRFFQGLPAPAAAGLALIPPMLERSSLQWVAPTWAAAGWTLLLAFLMSSRIAMLSPKGWRIRAEWVIPLMLVAGAITMGLLRDPWLTASGVFAVYLLTLPVAVVWRRAERRRIKAKQLAETAKSGAIMPEPNPPGNAGPL